MKYLRPLKFVAMGLCSLAGLVQVASAGGISVGSSGLINTLDYSDTFTVGAAGQPTQSDPRPDGMFNNNSFGGYNVENNYGHLAATWAPTDRFSFNSGANTTCCFYPGNAGAANGGNDAATGLAQGGNPQSSFGFNYGLRADYVVQLDSPLQSPTFGISGISIESGAGTANQLDVIFRSTNLGLAIAITNGTTETAVSTGSVLDANWHNFAVEFKPTELLIYRDQILAADVNLNTFVNGLYLGYSNSTVGASNRSTVGGNNQPNEVMWLDNFQVGAPVSVPEPSTFVLVALGFVGLFAVARRRK